MYKLFMIIIIIIILNHVYYFVKFRLELRRKLNMKQRCASYDACCIVSANFWRKFLIAFFNDIPKTTSFYCQFCDMALSSIGVAFI